MFDTYLRKNFNVLSKNKQKDVEDIRTQKRFVPFHDRPSTSHIHMDSFLMSQGVKDCMTWRNSRLGKSIYDFALIPMIIWENKPATILEIGSGEGASAIWMADVCKSYKLLTQVYSVDIEPPNSVYDGVTFLQGNSREIHSVFDVKNLPHPWIILEDAHIEMNKIMEYFTKHMHTGDYIIIEDSRSKMQSILKVPSDLLVDTYYCDYFGRNATCAVNTILRKK